MAHEHVFRWRYDRPPSLEQFQTMFPDDYSCAAYLAERRWPNGFVCPHCGSTKGWKLRGKPCLAATGEAGHRVLQDRLVCWFPRGTEPVRRIISIEN